MNKILKNAVKYFSRKYEKIFRLNLSYIRYIKYNIHNEH